MMMHKTIITTMLLLVAAMTASAENVFDGWEFTARVGYNIGGTTPVGMPATIRSLNKYKLRAIYRESPEQCSPTYISNLAFGIDASTHFTRRWGVLTGLHFDGKGMEVDATVKNYHMTMTQGGDEVEGYYTGNLVTDCDTWVLTLPVMATFNVSDKVMLKCGPYFSYVVLKRFKGYVYDGYLRRMLPIGEKIEMGNTNESRGTFDFSDKMRRLQVGIDFGVDWQIGRRWGAYADVQWGLSGVHHSSFNTIEQTLYPIYGTLGVMYKLK